MTIEELEIGLEVICTRLVPHPPEMFKMYAGGIRECGHIGQVYEILPFSGVIVLGHAERTLGGTFLHLTPFLAEELELYKPDALPMNELRKSIDKLQEWLLDE